MKEIRSWLLVLLAGAGLAVAGEQAVLTLDLDDIDTPSAHASSGQPDAAELETLAEKGYVAVIDLRGPGEDRGFDEAAAAEAAGLSYTPLPIASAATGRKASRSKCVTLATLLISFSCHR